MRVRQAAARPGPVRGHGGRSRHGRGGDRADALRARRSTTTSALLRAVPLRSADRARRARAPSPARAPAPGAVRGPGVGDLRAAHRSPSARPRSSGGSSGAGAGAAREPVCGTRRPRRAWPASRPPSSRRSTCPGAARWRCVALRAEVAAGRVDLRAPDHERGWRRLRTIPGIGAWTVESLALHGQGRYDQLPAGDLAYLKLVGRLRTGNPRARATRTRCASSSRPTRPGRASSARICWGARRMLPTRVTAPAPAGTRSSARRPAFGGRVSSWLRNIQSRRLPTRRGSWQPNGLRRAGREEAERRLHGRELEPGSRS